MCLSYVVLNWHCRLHDIWLLLLVMKALKCKTLDAELAHAYALHYNMKALKYKTLGAELTMHTHLLIMHIVQYKRHLL